MIVWLKHSRSVGGPGGVTLHQIKVIHENYCNPKLLLLLLLLTYGVYGGEGGEYGPVPALFIPATLHVHVPPKTRWLINISVVENIVSVVSGDTSW